MVNKDEQEAWRTVNAMFEEKKRDLLKKLGEKEKTIEEQNKALEEQKQLIENLMRKHKNE